MNKLRKMKTNNYLAQLTPRGNGIMETALGFLSELVGFDSNTFHISIFEA